MAIKPFLESNKSISMYSQIWKSYTAALPNFPKLRRPLIGAVIKETRIDKGIRQLDFANRIGINISTLKSIENDHQQATTVENLNRMALVLGLKAEELILLGCERDPANFFIYKKDAPPSIKGIRQRKRFPSEWHQSQRFRFANFDMTPISPPIATKKDFFICRINLPPKRSLESLTDAISLPFIMGYIASGFNLKLTSGKFVMSLTAQQGFGLREVKQVSLTNDDEDHAAVIYLIAKLPFSENSRIKPQTHRPLEGIHISEGIEMLRRQSNREGHLLSINHLADMTDSLNHEQIHKLMRMKQGSSVIYWEKIEDLLAGTGVSMEDFLDGCHRRKKESLQLVPALSRSLVDFSAYYGLKLHSCTPSGSDFFASEISVEGSEKMPRKPWERKDKAMIALYIEEGELEVTVGEKRSPMTLIKGESVYFDGNLGYKLRNPSKDQAKGFFATYPAVVF